MKITIVSKKLEGLSDAERAVYLRFINALINLRLYTKRLDIVNLKLKLDEDSHILFDQNVNSLIYVNENGTKMRFNPEIISELLEFIRLFGTRKLNENFEEFEDVIRKAKFEQSAKELCMTIESL